MLTKQEMLLDLMGRPTTRFVVPVFQRPYSWSERQCRELWEDVNRAGRFETTHFAGTVLYADDEPDADGLELLNVIDGQQRMATMTLLLLAFARYLQEHEGAVEDLTGNDVMERYLTVATSAGAVEKLALTQADRLTLSALVAGLPLPEDEDERSSQVVANYEQMRSYMADDSFDAARLWRGLCGLLVIVARLTQDDNPQLVFESLNSKGMPLSTGDLVRNALLVSVAYDEQTRLYESYWLPIEELFPGPTGQQRLTAAMHGWLATRFRKVKIRGAGDVYGAFRAYLRDEYDGDLETLLASLLEFCTKFASNEHFRTAATKDADEWIHGKPMELISERNLFGTD